MYSVCPLFTAYLLSFHLQPHGGLCCVSKSNEGLCIIVFKYLFHCIWVTNILHSNNGKVCMCAYIENIYEMIFHTIYVTDIYYVTLWDLYVYVNICKYMYMFFLCSEHSLQFFCGRYQCGIVDLGLFTKTVDPSACISAPLPTCCQPLPCIMVHFTALMFVFKPCGITPCYLSEILNLSTHPAWLFKDVQRPRYK